MAMADNQREDIGKFARHPLRTMGGAMMVGAAMGASLMAAKNHQSKTPMQKFMEKMSK
jgi:formate/nitrite transporter FocA (FNT family)